MSVSRRLLLGMATAAATTAPLVSRAQTRPIRAIAFDGFPIIDPRPVAARTEEMFPGRGAALVELWRSRQFDYCWLRTLGGRYADFWRVSEDALVFAAHALKLDLPDAKRAHLMQAWLELKAWPDVPDALGALHKAGIRMAFLSNFTSAMLDAGVRNARIGAMLEPHLSTDRVRAYKPDPRAYQMGLDAFSLPREEILFVASAGWDATGARWFGYPTAWVNRGALAGEELGADGVSTVGNLNEIVAMVAR